MLAGIAGKPRTRLTPNFALCILIVALRAVLSIEHTIRLPIRTYIALYLIRPLPYLRTACTPISARDSSKSYDQDAKCEIRSKPSSRLTCYTG
jgi:hypothetical protein